MVEDIYGVIEGVAAANLEHGYSFMIGIDGLDCSGKTCFAQGLAEHFRQRVENEVELYHLDDFNNFDVQQSIYTYLAEGRLSTTRRDQFYEAGRDHARALHEISGKNRFMDGVVIIVEGALFRKTFRHGFGCDVFLEVAPDRAEQHYFRRRDAEGDTRSIAAFRDLWLPVYTRYIEEYSPRDRARLVIDNNNVEKPRIVSQAE